METSEIDNFYKTVFSQASTRLGNRHDTFIEDMMKVVKCLKGKQYRRLIRESIRCIVDLYISISYEQTKSDDQLLRIFSVIEKMRENYKQYAADILNIIMTSMTLMNEEKKSEVYQIIDTYKHLYKRIDLP